VAVERLVDAAADEVAREDRAQIGAGQAPLGELGARVVRRPCAQRRSDGRSNGRSRLGVAAAFECDRVRWSEERRRRLGQLATAADPIGLGRAQRVYWRPVDTSRAWAKALDAGDPLASYAAAFVSTDPDLVYFDGNSLGRLPIRTVDALSRAVTKGWGDQLVRGWGSWIDLPIQVGDRLGRAALGAAPGQVVVCDSTTVNLYKLAGAALDARVGRRVVVTDGANFPTDRYVVEGLAAARGLTVRLVGTDSLLGVRADDVREAVDGDVALVTFSHVDYRSAAIAEVAAVNGIAHRAGALVLWDMSHAVGSVPVDLDGWGVDLAVGCSYKYLNGGPGAPAWLYVRRDLQDVLVPPIWGWFGQDDQFAMRPGYSPAPGIRRWLAGTPPVLGLVAVDEGIAIVEDAQLDRVRAKGEALTTYAISLADAWLAPLGFTLASPRDPCQRGSHIALRHPEAYRLSLALIDARVVPDFRAPDVLRIGLSPLSTRFAEVRDGLDRLCELASEHAWDRYDAQPGRVS